MIETELYTRAGEYVATIHLPPFVPRAEIICWGIRFFVLDHATGDYREGLVWVSTCSGFAGHAEGTR